MKKSQLFPLVATLVRTSRTSPAIIFGSQYSKCILPASRYAYIHTQRLSSSASSSSVSKVGVVFDIDGVVLRGYDTLPRARDSLLRLINANIPFLFLTNGGGELESVKRKKLSQVLGIPIEHTQVILSHTPLEPICKSYAEKRVLVLGCRDVVSVGRAYGLKNIVTARQLCEDDPHRYPFVTYEKKHLPHRETMKIEAVFILHDPNDWAPEIQVTLDVLTGGFPLGSGKGGGVDDDDDNDNDTEHHSHGHAPLPIKQAVPVFSSNGDLVFAGLYPVPRLAAGSFTVALKAMWTAVTGGGILHVTQYGKPQKVTFDFAAQRLQEWAHEALQIDWYKKSLVKASEHQAESGKAASASLSWGSPPREEVGKDSASSSSSSKSSAGGNNDDHSSSSKSKTVDRSLHSVQNSTTTNNNNNKLFERIFMVGDNPRADIKGANDAGAPWHSILVRTGVFQGPLGTNDPINPGKDVVQGIREAVDIVIAAAEEIKERESKKR